jgi:hypothetical protein
MNEEAMPSNALLHLLIRDRRPPRPHRALVPFLFYLPHGSGRLTFPTKELVVGNAFPGRALTRP